MKKLLLILLFFPMIGFGQNIDWNRYNLKFDGILTFNNYYQKSNNTLYINHLLNINEISEKTEFMCELWEKCDFEDQYGQSMRMIITFEIGLYDKLLNEYYNIMSLHIPEEEFDYIRDSQRNWLKVRDKSLEYIFSLQKKGWFAYEDLPILDLYKNRVSELLILFDLYAYRLDNTNDPHINIIINKISEKTDWDDHYSNWYEHNIRINEKKTYKSHKNGEVFYKEFFLYGKRIERYYYDNGQLKSEDFYTVHKDSHLNSRQDSISNTYYRNGQLKSVRYYDASLGDGGDRNQILNYDLKGRLISHYEPRVGEWKDYYQNGQISMLRKYNFGILKSSICWGEDGYEVECE